MSHWTSYTVDGTFTDWSDWGSCSHTCGNGTQVRTRECIGQAHDGADCDGSRQEEQACHIIYCPVDGVWDAWSEWGACSKTCTEGWRTRTRVCDGPYYDGKPCQGDGSETESCTDVEICPVDGVWSVWSDWSACTLTCGSGTHTHTRTCEGQAGTGADCEGPAEETEPCGEPCPEPGYWDEWADWSTCTVTCGGGTRTRQRTCILTNELSDPCQGDATATENCHEYTCQWKPSCNDLMELGLKDSVMAQIDPLGFGTPIWVYCNLHTMPGEGITQIAHKEPSDIVVDLTTGFRRDFEYNTTSLNIDNVLDVSKTCRQFISWKCTYAPITSSSGMITFAEDRQGTQVRFFPGADRDHENSCACGVTGTCFDPATKCNCDANDAVEREDSGYYSTADGVGLPIMSMMSSSSGAGPALLTVGPLECFGRANLTWGRR